MARALICDACETHAPLSGDNRRPPGWLQVTLEGPGDTFGLLHACSGGCAVRALATLLHDEGTPPDERDRCIVAGCDRPAEPLREHCDLHGVGVWGGRCPDEARPPEAGAGPLYRCELPVGHAGPHGVALGKVGEWRWHDHAREAHDREVSSGAG